MEILTVSIGIESHNKALVSASAGMGVSLLVSSGNVQINPDSNAVIMAECDNCEDCYDIVLLDIGTSAIQVIYTITDITDLEFAEVKELVNTVTSVIKRYVTFNEACKRKYRLRFVGVRVDIQKI